jgi:hypothetical protein
VSLLTWPGFDLPSASQLVGSGLAPLRISQLTLQEESGNSIILLGRQSAEAPLAYRDGLFQKVPLVEGRDPSKPDEVLVPQPLAAALGLAPGSRMSLSHNATTHVTVSGVYWPGRGKDPLVYADHRLLPQRARLHGRGAGAKVASARSMALMVAPGTGRASRRPRQRAGLHRSASATGRG